MINSGRKSFDRRGLGFVDENVTLSNDKIVFVKPCEEKFLRKLFLISSFIALIVEKWGTLLIDVIQDCLIIFKGN